MKEFRQDGTKEMKHSAGNYGLHGDVILFCEDLPKAFSKMPTVADSCLAYGEATGHAHKIFGEPKDYEIRKDPTSNVIYLKVHNPVYLKHQEHTPIKIPPGGYKIGIQTEYDPFTKLVRQVAD